MNLQTIILVDDCYGMLEGHDVIVYNSQTAEADGKQTIKEVLKSKNILDITQLDSHLSIQVELILSLSEKDISNEEVKIDSSSTSKVEHLQVKPSSA